MRKAPMAGVPMDGLPPRSKQNDVGATGAEAMTDDLTGTDFAEETTAEKENDRRTFNPRHSCPSRRYAAPAFNARHACPLRFSAAAVVLLLSIERFTRDQHARDLRYVPPRG